MRNKVTQETDNLPDNSKENMALNSVNRNITVGKLGDVYIFMPATGSYNGLAHKGNEVMNLSKSLHSNDQKKKSSRLLKLTLSYRQPEAHTDFTA